jgi:formylglycine-generating enzyme required for sulfatase activity
LLGIESPWKVADVQMSMAAQQYLEQLNQKFPPPEHWAYRLPTEAEWEYACRAETQTVFSFGDTLNGQQANYNGSVPCQTSQPGPFVNATVDVGSYAANAWALHDMHGHVEEFCRDCYDAYDVAVPVDPTGPQPVRIALGGTVSRANREKVAERVNVDGTSLCSATPGRALG